MNPQNANGNSAGAPFGGNFDATNSGARAAGGLSSGSFGGGANSNGSFGGGATSNGSLGAGSSAATSFTRSNVIASSSRTTPVQPMPMSGGTGDIILEPGAPKKPKGKKIMIIAILTVILIVGIVAVAMISSTSSGNNSENNIEDVETAFNKFANYIVNGSESDAFSDDEYSISTYYSLNAAITNHDEEYLARANQLLDDFTSKVDLENEENSVNVMAKAFKDDWGLIYAYANSHLYNDDYFVEYYLANGADEINNLIETEYQNMISTEHEQANSVAEAYSAYERYMLDFMEIAEQSGCIKDGAVDEACASNITLSQKQIEEASEIITDKDTADQTMTALIRSFIQDLWTMSEVLNAE